MINTESLANCSNETSCRSVLHCPELPEFIWDLNQITSFKIIDAITSIACPVTILLNLLVIIAVKTRRELKHNSNILLSSVALADPAFGERCLYATVCHVRRVSCKQCFRCRYCLFNSFHQCLCTVFYLRCVIFTLAPNCLGGVRGDS